MAQLSLDIQQRDLSHSLKALRKQYIIPGVVYGKELANAIPVQFDKNTFLSLYSEAGYSTPLTLLLDGESYLALIKEIDTDPVLDMLRHVSFHAVAADQEVEAEVGIEFVGESPLLEGGEFKTEVVRDTVLVAALPNSLPSSFIVDLSMLTEPTDSVHVSDLEIPDGVTIVDDGDLTLVTVSKVVVMTEEDSGDEEGSTEQEVGADSDGASSSVATDSE